MISDLLLQKLQPTVGEVLVAIAGGNGALIIAGAVGPLVALLPIKSPPFARGSPSPSGRTARSPRRDLKVSPHGKFSKPTETESRQAMSPKRPTEPGRPDKNAESDAKASRKKTRLENDLEEGLEDSFPASDPPSASEPGI